MASLKGQEGRQLSEDGRKVKMGRSICDYLSEYKYSLVLVVLFITLSPVSGKYCTVLKSQKKTHSHIKQEPCIQSYQAACGWFSSKMCTYYEHNMCERQVNQTKTYYSIVTECCPGYVHQLNDTCLKVDPADYHLYNLTKEGTSAHLTGDVEEEDDMPLSHGVFAGIGCGAIFIICVTVIIVIHIKKNEKKKIIMNQSGVEMKEQSEQMIRTEKTEKAETVVPEA